MAAKSKITSYFLPKGESDENNPATANQVTPGKRKYEEEDSQTNKKKTEECNSISLKNSSPTAKTAPPSPAQRARAQASKESAQLVLLCKGLPVLTANIGQTWVEALSQTFGQEWFGKLSSYVTKEREGHTVYPEQREVWEWTTRTRIEETRVVILGQDPYHGPGQAHGLCFSVKPGVAPPPSLVNIYKELESDIAGFSRPSHGCLAGWADQGVLLLNSVLTVRRGEANSHKNRGWEKLTDAVISWISKNLSGVVFLLWGSPAQKKALVVDGTKHHLLKSVHPSPLSAYRGFLGCKHFSQCNKLLSQQGKEPVDWARLPASLD